MTKKRNTRSNQRKRPHGADEKRGQPQTRNTNDDQAERGGNQAETASKGNGEPEEARSAPAPFESDLTATTVEPTDVSELHHPLWLNPDVPDQLRENPPLFRRLGLLIEQLAARGRSSIVKGCRTPNEGWYRAPLGGNRGSQYYLWWTRGNSAPGRPAGIPGNGILIEAARHHDDHRPLHAKPARDYLEVRQADQVDEHVAGSPWTENQQAFAQSTAPVRVLEGRPGSGKTTALWHAVDARANENVLYVTWSPALTDEAQAHFRSFSPKSVNALCVDFMTLLGWIAERDIERLPLRGSRKRLKNTLMALDTTVLKRWAFCLDGLYAEIRGTVLGGALLEKSRSTVQDGCLRQTDEYYHQHRKLETQSTTAVTRTLAALPSGTLNHAFPELEAAHDALKRLREGTWSPRLAETDRIVVDEVQDLTLTETSVIVELCRAIGEARGRSPFLLIAGDEGQNVRPTDFQWPRVRNLLTNRLQQPAVFSMESQVRCPRNIAQTIDAASRLYGGLNKNTRPKHQHKYHPADSTDGQVIHVETGGAEETGTLIQQLMEIENTVVISATNDIPEWLPENGREAVLTPAEVKGLEYQTACVLEPDRAVGRATPSDVATNALKQEQHEARRTAINELRVAVSRATETLVFISSGNETEYSGTKELLEEGATPYEADQLIEHLRSGDRTRVERVTGAIAEARQLREQNPHRAIQRAWQAVRLLGTPDTPDQIKDPQIRTEAADSLLATVAWAMVHGTEDHDNLRKMAIEACNAKYQTHADDGDDDANTPKTGTIAGTLEDYERSERLTAERELVLDLYTWTAPDGDAHAALEIAMLASILGDLSSSGTHWATAAIQSQRHKLIEDLWKCARNPDNARSYTVAEVERWLKAVDPAHDPRELAHELSRTAFDTLLATKPTRRGARPSRDTLDDAEAILLGLDDDPLREGQIEEAEGRTETAIACYRRASADEHLLSVMRENAMWELRASEGDDQARGDAAWLLEVERTVRAKPDGIDGRLSDADRNRLADAIAELADSE